MKRCACSERIGYVRLALRRSGTWLRRDWRGSVYGPKAQPNFCKGWSIWRASGRSHIVWTSLAHKITVATHMQGSYSWFDLTFQMQSYDACMKNNIPFNHTCFSLMQYPWSFILQSLSNSASIHTFRSSSYHFRKIRWSLVPHIISLSLHIQIALLLVGSGIARITMNCWSFWRYAHPKRMECDHWYVHP